MKVVVLCLVLFASAISAFSPVSIFRDEEGRQCSRGPTYWCQNIRTAKPCQAVKHCIQTVWRYKVLPEDNNDVCKICKDMVAEARAQLESNETQEELKEVFEGTCALIPLKPVAKECMKLADEFVPELVETLASQMNPQVVCAVAGLCNNAEIDKLLAEKSTASNPVVQDCERCYNMTAIMRKNFFDLSRDDLLNNFLEACGRLGSFSDSCSAVVVSYFDNLYQHLTVHLNPQEICDFAAMCTYKYHDHRKDNVELTIESSVGVVKAEKDDVPCDFCEQLVVHLKQILTANTTEDEFRMVLRGLCKQTGSFSQECLSLVDEYYAVIYNFIVKTLNPKEVCTTIGICPSETAQKGPIWPLLPLDVVDKLQSMSDAGEEDPDILPLTPLNSVPTVQEIKENTTKLYRVPLTKLDIATTKAEEKNMQLPIERMMIQTPQFLMRGELCEVCQFILHYVQQVLTTPATESEIEHVVKHVCDELPKQIVDQCKYFIDSYGDAVIALLAQEIDPSQVCPKLNICPGGKTLIDLSNSVDDKPTCPLCLLAVQDLQNTLKNNKTEASIRKALDGLCSRLSKSLAAECKTFVDEYSDQLVDMLVADFTPQEVCAYLKLCDPSPKPGDEITSNEIPTSAPARAMPQDIIHTEIAKYHGEACVMCEFVLSKIQDQLKDKKTEDEIKTMVHDVCNYMPQTVAKECNDFVNQYADLIITLLAETVDPKSVCTMIKLCNPKKVIKDSVADCAVCDVAMGEFQKRMESSPKGKDTSVIKRVCDSVPEKYGSKCTQLVDIYGPSIIHLVEKKTEFHQICEMIGKCPKGRQTTNLVGGEKCTWGPSYWCQSEDHATACGAKLHCQEKVWKSEKPKTK